jgi:Rieske Fe-S protein
MTNGTTAGAIIADGILGRKNEFHEIFDSTRTDLVHSIKKESQHNLETAKHYVGDKVKEFITHKSIDDLKIGEAGYIHIDGSLRAAYRDEKDVHIVSPSCTHMGCTVVFNKEELTWDCPCHGSRFACDGSILDGPAVEPLEQVSIT